MIENITHIEEYLDKASFPYPADQVHLQTRFGQGTLLVFWVMEQQFIEYKMTIEEYFQISLKRKVTFKDFH